MSKGSRAVCMRFPEPYMGEIEAEAEAKGISVPELCRIIIIERNEVIERERAKAVQVTPSPKPLTVVSPSGSPGTGTPRPLTVPVAPVKTETMKRNEERLAKLIEKHSELFTNWIAEQITKGKMSIEEAVKFLGG